MTRPKTTASLQALIDTYHFLARSVRREPTTAALQRSVVAARTMVVPTTLKREMLATLRALPTGLALTGLSAASVRINEALFLLSDADCPLAHTNESNLAALSFIERDNEGVHPNAEWHRWIYTHSDAGAVLVVHPVYAVSCAVKGVTLDPFAFPAAAGKVGEVVIVSDVPAGWQQAVALKAMLLVKDGALITYDRTLERAIAKAEIIARWCEIQTIGRKE